jgi:hypothetical protein
MKNIAIEGDRGTRRRGPAWRGTRRTHRRAGSPFPDLMGRSESFACSLVANLFAYPYEYPAAWHRESSAASSRVSRKSLNKKLTAPVGSKLAALPVSSANSTREIHLI